MQQKTAEQRALSVNKWANLFMGACGVAGSLASRSDALMVDGLYSGVNFLSAIIAIRVSQRVGRAPDRSRPWGYALEESLYVTFRSLVLVGILLFAAFGSAAKITTFLTGGPVPELVFGPIVVYSVAMVIICTGLAIYFRHVYVRTGRTSSILEAETRSAIVDGAITFGTGAALISLPFLNDTPLAPIVPIGDAIVVLVMTLIIVWQPLGLFRNALAELAGVSAPAKTHQAVSRAARDLARTYRYRFLRAVVQRAGRTHFAVVYVDPAEPVRAADVDRFWRDLSGRLADLVGPIQCEVVVTEIAAVDPAMDP